MWIRFGKEEANLWILIQHLLLIRQGLSSVHEGRKTLDSIPFAFVERFERPAYQAEHVRYHAPVRQH